MAIKHYMKQPRTQLKNILFNRDRGVWEKDDLSPAGHSNKFTHEFVMALGAPPVLVIPVGFTAYITYAAWVWTANTALPGLEVYVLTDGTNPVTIFSS